METTIPPLNKRQGLVCPRCYKPLDPSSARYDTAGPGALPRCPEHGLAFVEARELMRSHDAMLGTTVAGRFTVLSRLGAGSMGAVYRARQEAVGRDVALKIVTEGADDPDSHVRFEREARATSSLVSPHTVTVYDFGEAEEGFLFLAMELLEGESLGERLRRRGRLPLEDALRITRHALRSLAEAHGKGIVHRDLKPDNLFLVKRPDMDGPEAEVCKVLDFGIAKVLSPEQRVDQLETQAGTVFGTPRYMSPEQAQGNELDARTDLYSLGVILYHMLTGRAPFVDDDAVVVMAAHIKEKPPPVAEVAPEANVPPAVEKVLRRALAKAPDARFQTAEEMGLELEAASSSSSAASSGLHAGWVGHSDTRFKRQRGKQMAAGAVLALLVAGGFALTWSSRGRVEQAVSSNETTAQGAQPPVESLPVPAPTPTVQEVVPATSGSAEALDPSPPASASANGPRAPVRRAPKSVRKLGRDKYGRFVH